jgi:hypothetical protein
MHECTPYMQVLPVPYESIESSDPGTSGAARGSHRDPVRAWLIAGSSDGCIRLWCVCAESAACLREFDGALMHRSKVVSLALLPARVAPVQAGRPARPQMQTQASLQSSQDAPAFLSAAGHMNLEGLRRVVK